MTFLQEQFLKFAEVSERVDSKLKTIDNLLKLGMFKYKKPGNILGLDIENKTVYEDDDTNFTMAYGMKAGDKYPNHIHELSHQYLICVKGSFAVELYSFKTIVRIIEPGQCVSIPAGHEHSVTALEDNSKCATICVPAEKSYNKK